MDFEVELTYRLTGHLTEDERVIATLISSRDEIYAATDQRVLGLTRQRIGYALRVHPYEGLQDVRLHQDGGSSFVRFFSDAGELTIRARSQKEAERFVASVGCRVGKTERAAV